MCLLTPLTVVTAVLGAFEAVVVGQLTADPGPRNLVLFASLTGASLLVTWVSVFTWRAVAAAGERRLRGELLEATLRQPLPALEDQAVGGLLERVEADPVDLATALRIVGWGIFSAAFGVVAAWVTAGLTWWPAWFAFPLAGVLAYLASRGSGARIRQAAEAEQEAWSAEAAQLEETLAAADDLRTAGGRGFALRRYARRCAQAISRQLVTRWATAVVTFRLELVLAVLTGLVVVGGVWAVTADRLGTARFVTLFFLVVAFTGQIAALTGRLPQIQEALGTLARVRALLAATPEPAGGVRLPEPDSSRPGAEVTFTGLTFTYTTEAGDGFTLGPVDLTVPTGTTLALVGRTGSGKTTLTKVLSRAVEPPTGTVLLDGVDVTALDLEHLRSVVGVVGQRTEILAGTLRDNLSLYQPMPEQRVAHAIEALGLTGWVDSLPDGLDTILGPHGRRLSAGEEQLVAFGRLLVRDVRVVVLDEATARMDARTARTVTQAAGRLLAGRTAIIVAHRLSTARHADQVAVLHDGHVAEHGTWQQVAGRQGRLAALISADGPAATDGVDDSAASEQQPAPVTPAASVDRVDPVAPVGTAAGMRTVPRLTARGFTALVARVAVSRPRWWVVSETAWWVTDLIGPRGIVTGLVWAALVTALNGGQTPLLAAAGFTAALLLVPALPLLISRPSTLWSLDAVLRMRATILDAQMSHEPPAGPVALRGASGEITARTRETGRIPGLANQARDVVIGILNLAVLGAVTRSWVAVGLGAAVIAAAAVSSTAGGRTVRNATRQARDARAVFSRDLASVLDSVRTIKLAAATHAALARLHARDIERVHTAEREARAGYVVAQIRIVTLHAATIATWWLHVAGIWPLSTTLVVATVLNTYGAVGWALAGVIVRAAPTRDVADDGRRLAACDQLDAIPEGTDLVAGTHHAPPPATAPPRLQELQVTGGQAVHPNGAIAVSGVELTVQAGEMIAVVGAIGSGKSSLLAGLAGLNRFEGTVTWNGRPVPHLAPWCGTRIGYVAQVPRVVSGTIAENVHLDHGDRDVKDVLHVAQMDDDVTAAGGVETLVGHRGLRLSGGQTQRLALARALAVNPDLLLLDDVSSALDATTEAALWDQLSATGATIIATTSRQATLERADTVIVLDAGRQVATGTWADLRGWWGHLAG